jgi:hypothetical protein
MRGSRLCPAARAPPASRTATRRLPAPPALSTPPRGMDDRCRPKVVPLQPSAPACAPQRAAVFESQHSH